MNRKTRGIGEPLRMDELQGYDGFVDRLGTGLTNGDIMRLVFKRARFSLIVMAIFMMVFMLPIFLVDPVGGIIMFFVFLMTFGVIGAALVLALFCSGRTFAKVLKENNYLLVLKDRLVVQNQVDIMAHVLRNEVPIKDIRAIERATDSYFEERRRRTNVCTRIFTGTYDLPVGGLHPIASRKECLVVLHLREPLEIHCSGRNANGFYQFGDKREYVKEVIIAVDPKAQERFMEYLVSM